MSNFDINDMGMESLASMIQVRGGRPFIKRVTSMSGKRGLQPNYPIVSYGIIAIKGIYSKLDMCINTLYTHNERFPRTTKQLGDIEYLMICRSNTFGYIDFMKGNYSLNNLQHIQILINEMTVSEKYDILTLTFEELYIRLTKPSKQHINVRNDESKKKFECLRTGLIVSGEIVSLQKLIDCSNSQWINNEWEFPKGRKNYKEKDLDCAKREFQEETGISSTKLQIINNVMPFEETFIGSNQKCYKNVYYLGIIDTDVELTNYQETEVSIMEWKSYTECIESIRDYNVEKISLLTNVHNFIQNVYFI
jgi:ADP-ribose pyrophosphatase YjhB (NUDIX family)